MGNSDSVRTYSNRTLIDKGDAMRFDPVLTLVVIRSNDLEVSQAFYSAIGLEFVEEQHVNGPVHLAATLVECVFEIYPSNGSASNTGTRLGFEVDSIADILEALGDQVKIIKPASREEGNNLHAVLEDPDGHKVELTERVW